MEDLAIFDYIGLIMLCVLAVAAIIGFFVGLKKGFLEMSSWANEFVLASVAAILVGYYAVDYITELVPDAGGWLGFAVVLGTGIVVLLVFMAISAAFRRVFEKGVRRHRRKLGYVNMEAKEESDRDIVDALSRKDFRAYKKLSRKQKKTLKSHRGGWGFWDRIFGAITGFVKYFVVVALILVSCLVVLDLTGISLDEGATALTEQYLYSIFQSETWQAIQPYIMDFVLIGVTCACIRRGYKSGIFSGLWTLVAIVLVIFGFYIAYLIVATSGSFDGLADTLVNNVLSGYLGDGDISLTIATVILTAGLGLVFAVVIILLAIFIPRAIDAARDTKVFHFVDGLLGAVIVSVLVLGILMFLFGMLGTLNDLQHVPDIFVKLNSYFSGSLSRYFYSDNFLATFEWFPNLATLITTVPE